MTSSTSNISPLSSQETMTVNRRLRVFANALFFVIGFSLVFIVGWGGTATLFGQLFGTYKSIIAKIGGVVVILFGLVTLDVIKVSWLNYDTRPVYTGKQRGGLWSSALLGIFFASGWSPCIGTSLGAILTLGMSEENVWQAMILAGGFAMGMSVPFLAIGLGIAQATQYVRRFQRYLRGIQIASGVLLIILGVMLLTNQLTLIAIWAQRNGLVLELPLGAAATPTFFIAAVAGLLSFLSPCVLPLVPAYIGHLSAQSFRQDSA